MARRASRQSVKSSRTRPLQKKNTSTSITTVNIIEMPPPVKKVKYRPVNENFPEDCPPCKMPELIHSTKTTYDRLGKFNYQKYLALS